MKQLKTYGNIYSRHFISPFERKEILSYLDTLGPLWEQRFSEHFPPPEGDQHRPLLRPVYWLGNWQFACLGYYHPPKGIEFRAMRAEPYPPILFKIVKRIEDKIRQTIRPIDIPKKFELNTCLINFYGEKLDPLTQKIVDTARVGDHQDFEPGPVASLSLGDRAFFQFVHGKIKGPAGVMHEQWLEDSSLQIFAGTQFKEKLFHRVQRVENKRNEVFPPQIVGFKTRRVNFTFRYVPREHFFDWKDATPPIKSDVRIYMDELAKKSAYFKHLLVD